MAMEAVRPLLHNERSKQMGPCDQPRGKVVRFLEASS